MSGLRPPTNYFGGKARLSGLITGLMPAHRTYVEPYAGSAALLFAKRPSPTEVISDLDGQVVNFFRILRERPDDLVRALELTPYSRQEYDRCAATLDEPGLDDVERARRWWTVVNQSMHRGNRRGGSGWAAAPNTGSQDHPGKLVSLTGRLHACARRLRTVTVEHMPALDVIGKYARRDDVLVYADPPYLGSTRQTLSGYAADMTGDDDHRRLAEVLRAVPGPVLLSGYASDLYDEELYPDWHRLEIRVDVPSAGRARTRVATEVIWSNRPLAGQQLTLLTSEEEVA